LLVLIHAKGISMNETHCCKNEGISPPKTAICPVNGKHYAQVAMKTVLHNVAKPWKRQLAAQGYYFCSDPECKVVYFGEDESLITVADIRTVVGIKSSRADRPVCYCFDISQHDLELNPETCRRYVIEKTSEATCECEIRNPSGRCCLRDFSNK
jgi:hypothetical protein